MSIKWGYSLNCWTHQSNSVRKDNNERNFKVCSVAGFSGVEMQTGMGRWKPLGGPKIIGQIYGSTADFKTYLEGLGISDIIAWDYDSGKMFDFNPGASPCDILNRDDHDRILSEVKEYFNTLELWNSKYFVVRPMPSYWAVAPVTEEKLKVAAELWNKVGKLGAEHGIKTLIHIDWMCAANSKEAIAYLMENTDPSFVGLCIDTAEFAILGLDPVLFYEEYADRTELIHFQQAVTTDLGEEYKKPFAEDIINDGGERKIQRWFWEMDLLEGQGVVDFELFVRVLKKHGYDGWVVVECQQSPDPAESVLLNGWYVQKVLSRI